MKPSIHKEQLMAICQVGIFLELCTSYSYLELLQLSILANCLFPAAFIVNVVYTILHTRGC